MEGGLPLVTMSTVFQPSISLYFHLPRTSFQYAVNLVVQLYQPTHMLLHERVLLYAVNLELQLLFTCIILERVFLSPSIRTIKRFITALFSNECLPPSIRIYHYLHLQCPIWPHLQRLRARKGHLYFILSRYLEYLSPSRSRPRFMLVLMLIRSRCN